MATAYIKLNIFGEFSSLRACLTEIIMRLMMYLAKDGSHGVALYCSNE